MNSFFDVDDGVADSEYTDNVSVDKSVKTKSLTLFDHIKAITERGYDKDYFNNMSESDARTFSVYMINRFLSMYIDNKTKEPEWLSLVNYFQRYTQHMTPEMVYKFYVSSIPTGRVFLKYVKGKSESKYNKDLIALISRYYEVSTRQAYEYIDLLHELPNGVDELKMICSMYGNDEKEIKKLMKV